jgi:hypothetical protein
MDRKRCRDEAGYHRGSEKKEGNSIRATHGAIMCLSIEVEWQGPGRVSAEDEPYHALTKRRYPQLSQLKTSEGAGEVQTKTP